MPPRRRKMNRAVLHLTSGKWRCAQCYALHLPEGVMRNVKFPEIGGAASENKQ